MRQGASNYVDWHLHLHAFRALCLGAFRDKDNPGLWGIPSDVALL